MEFKIEKNTCYTLDINNVDNNFKEDVTMENNIPKKIYKAIHKRNSIDDYYLIDEFSGYLLKEAHSLELSNDIMTVNEFIELLPEFHYEG